MGGNLLSYLQQFTFRVWNTKPFKQFQTLEAQMVFFSHWLILIFSLFFTTFGLKLCVVSLTGTFLFLLGFTTWMYIKQNKDYNYYFPKKNVDLSSNNYKLAEKMKKPRKDFKVDRRLTGSQVIDEQLQEILDYMIRDYVYPWYDLVSDSEEVPHEIRVAAQNVIVAFANRVKEVDWIPFLTTRLVDDAASHLRLYRQARARVQSMPQGSKISLEEAFFDLELAMESGLVCRDHISLTPSLQRSYLQQLTDVVLFYLSPEVEFHCLPLRYITRELIVNSVLIPLITKLSDPDYINQIIIWLGKDMSVTSEVFLTVLKVNDNVEELAATKEILNKELTILRSRDAGGESETLIKQQLSSLNYLAKLVTNQIARLQSGADPGPDYSRLLLGSSKLFQLPLDVLLKNNMALSHFMDHMTSVGAQSYLFFYLNIEGWRASTEQQLADMVQTSLEKSEVLLAEHYSAAKQTLERIREAAHSIFEQYLTEKSSCKLDIDEVVVKRLLYRIKTEKPNETWFDEAQACVFEKMQTDDRCLYGFRNSPAYVKLLSELHLLRGDSGIDEAALVLASGLAEDDDDSASLDEVSLNSDTASLPEFVISHNSSTETDNGSGGSPSNLPDTKPIGPFILYAEIIETGLVHEKGKTFGVYAVTISKKYESGQRESWHIYRRYSDFHELHRKIKEKFPELSKLPFPAKKTFHNMERKTLERRMICLNSYIKSLTQPAMLTSKPGLLPLLLTFFSPSGYRASTHLSATLDSLLRMSMQAVRTVPDSVLSSVDGMVDGLSRVLQVRTATTAKDSITREGPETLKVGASLDTETADNIPMRILLLLMTEVFELKSSSQWLRRRLVIILRQVVRTMFGDIVNRRILDYVSLLTSPNKVATYLSAFKDAYWPNGMPSEPTQSRDQATKMRTRVAAKAALLSSLSDDIKHILGSETTLTGILSVFGLLQVTRLNTRLICVLMEGALSNLFAGSAQVIRRLHCKSHRIEEARSPYNSLPTVLKPSTP
ncbi:sorting nexin-13-like isoform X2 [Rhodnius prolixus]|uniref:sorting nexin-13-like isoform X2 n=1 Tax=Rhodnius prolixus TaxID=13249 RepID=UPI003D18F37F